MNIYFANTDKSIDSLKPKIESLVNEFLGEFHILEKNVNVATDKRTNAFYLESHILARDIIEKGTIDVPLDPDNQPEYRANREIVENNPAYLKMIDDANKKRIFSNIVAEFNTKFDKDFPIKIIGGQHRFLAIEDALSNSVNEYHGFKVYFGLNIEQRLDVQLISNTNIAVSNDLLDRMFETVKGPELRNWSQEVGILKSGQDFTDRKQRGSQISVRGVRTFILNYVEGKKIPDKEFNKINTIPVLAKTGGIDEEWEKTRTDSAIWYDKKLKKIGKAFAKLIDKQREYFQKKKNQNYEFADKPLSYATLAAWAFIAGVINKNTIRLERHFKLADITSTDPLNALILAKGRHKTDPTNYRGLGTRTDVKDRGRLSELFFLQAEKGGGINKKLVDLAVERYHAKQAMLRVKEMEKNL